MKQLAPSLHMLEIFMPAVTDENFFVQKILPDVAKIPFYTGIELPVIFKKENQKLVRKIVEDRDYQLTIWASPNINEKGDNLSALDPEERRRAVAYVKELLAEAAESGAYHVGLPSGPDVLPEKREDAKKALFESFCEISQEASKYQNMHLTLEPLDRYVHKKQLMGPIHEVIDWFEGLKKECPNFYIHWDSAHEALAEIDLEESMKRALPYMAQFHICNCVTDPSNPCYGDWHMELGNAPEYKNWGYLNLQGAAKMLRTAAEAETPAGIRDVHVGVEVRTHMGDDLWKREGEIRSFLQAAFDEAGLNYNK